MLADDQECEGKDGHDIYFRMLPRLSFFLLFPLPYHPWRTRLNASQVGQHGQTRPKMLVLAVRPVWK